MMITPGQPVFPDHPMRRVAELLLWQWCGSCRQAA